MHRLLITLTLIFSTSLLFCQTTPCEAVEDQEVFFPYEDDQSVYSIDNVSTNDQGVVLLFTDQLDGGRFGLTVLRADSLGKELWRYAYRSRFDIVLDHLVKDDQGAVYLATGLRVSESEYSLSIISLGDGQVMDTIDLAWDTASGAPSSVYWLDNQWIVRSYLYDTVAETSTTRFTFYTDDGIKEKQVDYPRYLKPWVKRDAGSSLLGFKFGELDTLIVLDATGQFHFPTNDRTSIQLPQSNWFEFDTLLVSRNTFAKVIGDHLYYDVTLEHKNTLPGLSEGEIVFLVQYTPSTGIEDTLIQWQFSEPNMHPLQWLVSIEQQCIDVLRDSAVKVDSIPYPVNIWRYDLTGAPLDTFAFTYTDGFSLPILWGNSHYRHLNFAAQNWGSVYDKKIRVWYDENWNEQHILYDTLGFTSDGIAVNQYGLWLRKGHYINEEFSFYNYASTQRETYLFDSSVTMENPFLYLQVKNGGGYVVASGRGNVKYAGLNEASTGNWTSLPYRHWIRTYYSPDGTLVTRNPAVDGVFYAWMISTVGDTLWHKIFYEDQPATYQANINAGGEGIIVYYGYQQADDEIVVWFTNQEGLYGRQIIDTDIKAYSPKFQLHYDEVEAKWILVVSGESNTVWYTLSPDGQVDLLGKHEGISYQLFVDDQYVIGLLSQDKYLYKIYDPRWQTIEAINTDFGQSNRIHKRKAGWYISQPTLSGVDLYRTDDKKLNSIEKVGELPLHELGIDDEEIIYLEDYIVVIAEDYNRPYHLFQVHWFDWNGNLICSNEKKQSYELGYYHYQDHAVVQNNLYIAYRAQNIGRSGWLRYPLSEHLQDADQPLSQELFAYPNPASDLFRVQWEWPYEEAGQLMIFNALGQAVERRTVSGGGFATRQLDLQVQPDWQQGLYTIALYRNGEIISSQKISLIKPR